MPLPDPILFSAAKHTHLIPQLAQIHADCITHDGTIANFLPPLSQQIMIDFWTGYAKDVTDGKREIALQMSSEANDAELAGYVSLYMPHTQTGPFRADVLKLMVSPKFRKLGVAKRVMGKLEEVAKERKTELLMLDTVVGTPAEHVYPKLGYKRMGVVPNYGIDPRSGELQDEVWFYKDLREQEVCWRPGMN